jgi:hypothetical protein
MIEFRLQIDSRLTRAVVPLIVQCFSASGKKANASYPYFDEDDSDLTDSWEISLKEDFAKDRQSLARLLNDPKFAHGYIEVDESETELVLRAVTEVRLFIRYTKLDAFTDVELETGNFSLSRKSKEAQSYYLAYLILAEVQERLIEASAS